MLSKFFVVGGILIGGRGRAFRDPLATPMAGLMSKNEFEETKQYLHLADNLTLDKTDMFAKV